ncbi:MAG: glycosyltransferase family 4 protein, partial [Pyrobaculum sp.]
EKEEKTPDGVTFIRFDLKISSNVSNREVVAKEVKKPTGLLKLILDRTVFAIKALRYSLDDYDVIHVHLPFAANVLIHLRRGLRKKIVYTAHVGEEKKRFGLSRDAPVFLKWFSPDLHLMKRVAKTVVLNEAVRDILLKRGFPPERLRVIPLGVEVEEYNVDRRRVEEVRKKYGLSGVVVMCACTVTPRKGVEYLVRAAELIGRRDVQFLIVGNTEIDREYYSRLLQYVKERRLNVYFTGFVPFEDLKALYAASDIFVLPSLEEGFPVAVMEALATGKPVIGSKTGGIPMQIIEGHNGFLIEPGDYEQLAERLLRLIDDEKLRNAMGNNSRKLAVERFSWWSIAKAYLEVYQEVLQ